MELKLSIITVTYKDPEGLAQTLASLSALPSLIQVQWEHIVVDSSPEISATVLQKIPAGWPLRHLRVPAEGIYRAMNSGVTAALGQALWFLNGGDTLRDANALISRLNELIADSKLDMICGGCELTRQGEVLYPRLPKETFLKSILYRNELSHQAVLYKKDFMGKVGPFDPAFRIAADYEHYFRAFIAGARVKCVKDRLVFCDLGGTSNIRWRDSIKEAKAISSKWRGKLPKRVYVIHQTSMWMEYARVGSLKLLAGSGLSFLRKLWIWKNRRAHGSQ